MDRGQRPLVQGPQGPRRHGRARRSHHSLGRWGDRVSFTPSACQREAIEAPPGPLLVLAGPGAGKTFCLIERIRFLIERLGFDPARICAVTFTTHAAEQIAERLQSLGDRARGVKRGTLHALCVEILREHGEWVGLRRGFGIADQEYQLGVLRRLGVWDKRRGWLLGRFGLHRAKGVTLTNDDLATFQSYCGYLEHRNLIDFDDIIGKTAELFSKYEEIAEQVAGRWDYLLVDEFQDLTPLQYAVVRRMAWKHRNLFVVGDDEQSVYSWTGADPRVLRDFANDFGLTRTVLLDENRRTARQIFETARRLLRQNPSLFEEKVLRAPRESPFPVRALGFPDEAAEAAWLLADLLADQGRTGLPWGEYGVLYRTHEIGELHATDVFLLAEHVVRLRDHPGGRDEVPDHRVVRERAPRREAAGDARADQLGLEQLADLVGAVEHAIFAPGQSGPALIGEEIGEEPRGLGGLVRESQRAHRERRLTPGAQHLLLEEARILPEQAARGFEDLPGRAAVLVENHDPGEVEVVHELAEDPRIRAGPGVDRLLVVTHAEEVLVLPGEPAH